jgi:hypothetical protein
LDLHYLLWFVKRPNIYCLLGFEIFWFLNFGLFPVNVQLISKGMMDFLNFFVSIVHFNYCHEFVFDCNVWKIVLVATGSKIWSLRPSFSIGS